MGDKTRKSESGKRGGKRSKRKKKKPTLAEQADRFDCYQQSVQVPEHEVEFFEQAFRDEFDRKPLSLREDFCGTFAVSCEWVASNTRRTAVAVDLCEETLGWGREHNLSRLNESQQERVKILTQDARTRNRPPVDVVAAQNFSFWIFRTRAEVVEYFRAVHANLKREGILVMDMMGGGACYEEGHVDKRVIRKGKRGFRYFWEQEEFNPVDAHARFNISFKFADGSSLKRAFTYDWRFWTIPEVREMLAEAGFAGSYTYWEEEDDDGEGTGEWKRADTAASHPSWIAYLVGIK